MVGFAQAEKMTDDRPRNTGLMQISLRCGPKRVRAKPCRSPAVNGKQRYRCMAAHRDGAPRSNKNALKHGFYTRAAKAQRRQLQALIEQSGILIRDIK
jgi:glucans biosynthesis protein